MFGISFSELVVIMLLGVVVLGPERMVRVAHNLGRWVGKFKVAVAKAEAEIRQAGALEEIREIKEMEEFKGIGSLRGGVDFRRLLEDEEVQRSEILAVDSKKEDDGDILDVKVLEVEKDSDDGGLKERLSQFFLERSQGVRGVLLEPSLGVEAESEVVFLEGGFKEVGEVEVLVLGEVKEGVKFERRFLKGRS